MLFNFDPCPSTSGFANPTSYVRTNDGEDAVRADSSISFVTTEAHQLGASATSWARYKLTSLALSVHIG